MKNILICLENFDCGGVETYVLSQSRLLSKKYKITIVSGGGDLVNSLKEYDINHEKIDFFDFSLRGFIRTRKRLREVVEKYSIDYVILHPFTTYFSCVPVFLSLNIPYSLVIHDSMAGIYWKNYFPYPKYFLEKFVFKYSSSVIFVSKGSRKKYLNDFEIEKSKCHVISNGVDLGVFRNSNLEIDGHLRKFLVVSRLDDDKFISVKNAIRLVVYYQNIYGFSGIELCIAGKGNREEEIRKILVKQKNISWTMLGNVVYVEKLIPKFQVVLGMGRVSIESIACGRITIISGYKKLKAIVKPLIFVRAMNRNFSGRGLKSEGIDLLVKELNFSKEYFYDICKKNQELLYKKLNLDNLTNLFTNTLFNRVLIYKKSLAELRWLEIIVFFLVGSYYKFFGFKKFKRTLKALFKFGTEKRQILF